MAGSQLVSKEYQFEMFGLNGKITKIIEGLPIVIKVDFWDMYQKHGSDMFEGNCFSRKDNADNLIPQNVGIGNTIKDVTLYLGGNDGKEYSFKGNITMANEPTKYRVTPTMQELEYGKYWIFHVTGAKKNVP